jgi:hypothetical protein
MGSSGRNDTWTPNASGQSGDNALSGNVTQQQVQGYYTMWVKRVSDVGFVVGAA